jgi:hypothetical protein
LERGSDFEFSKERLFLFEGFLESKTRDLLSGGVNLVVVISSEFLVKDSLSLLDLGNIFSDTGSDEVVLEPAVGSFDLTSGLRWKGMSDLHIAVLENLFPLRGGFIGEEVVLIPEGVSSSDKSEDGVRIDIIAVGEPILKDDGLEGQDMGPAGFFLDQNGIEHESAIIIQGGDEVPFLFGSGCPEVMGGVMLNQFSDITG